MSQTIYVDVYFCLNFLMDFVVLLITRVIRKNKRNILGITGSAVMGALYAVVILLFPINKIVECICTYIIVVQLMCLISFGRMSWKNNIKNMITLYMVTFFLSGVINAIYYGTNFGKDIVELACMDMFGNISISFMICVTVIITVMVVTISDRVRKSVNLAKNIFPVVISVDAKKISVMALCDTGNSLIEPMTKKPVSVIEQCRLNAFAGRNMKYLMVPYNSVGKSHGLMRAFIADCLEVNGKTIENAIIGIHEGKLSQNRKYEMILHPDILENKEK